MAVLVTGVCVGFTASGRKHKDTTVVEEPNFSGQMSAMEATVYQTFKVNMLSSLVLKAPIQLGEHQLVAEDSPSCDCLDMET